MARTRTATLVRAHALAQAVTDAQRRATTEARTFTNPYDATTVIRPAEMPLLCLEDEGAWSLHLDAGTVVILDADQARQIVDNHLSQIVGGPFELGEIPDETAFTTAANTIALRVRADAVAAEAEHRADLEAFARTLSPALATRVLHE